MNQAKALKLLEDSRKQREVAAAMERKAGAQTRKALKVLTDSKLLTISEAARKAGISRPTAYKMLKD